MIFYFNYFISFDGNDTVMLIRFRMILPFFTKSSE